MKKNRKIRTEITIYTLAFAGMLLVTIWVLQVLFLDFFYERAVHNEIISSAQEIKEDINSEIISEKVERLSDERSVDIKVLFENDGVYNYIQSLSYGSILKSDSNVRYYIYKTETSGGEYFVRHTEELKMPDDDGDGPPPPFDKHDKNKHDDLVTVDESQSLVYSISTQTSDGKKAYVMVSAELEPVDSTVKAITSQFTFMVLIFIIIAVLGGLYISRKLSSPIVSINESAKKLAKGDYSADFNGDGFKETSELSSTLNYAAQELSKTDDFRRELIANISHDLRTPLTMIMGYGEAMRDIPDENTPENVQVIIDEAEHLRRLVNDILSLSKIESGMDIINAEDFDITESIIDIVSRYSKMKAAEGYEINFEYTENVTVKADELKISQAIYNLINNAINFTGDDKRVTVRQILTDKTVRIEVIDTGCGIAEENLKNIWDRYYKENKAHKRANVGTGLGLSIVKGVMELHGGTYGVISKENEGSTFWFELEVHHE